MNLKTADVIGQIDQRIKEGEYNNFLATQYRLIQIRGKILHGKRLSQNDIQTLKKEQFYLG